jgi:hypothetical protein
MRSTAVTPLVFCLFLAFPVFPQSNEPAKSDVIETVPLTVGAGVPLRVYLTQRLTKRLGEPVHARLVEPVFAFDREVIPANTEVIGEVVRVDPVTKMRRATAIAGGDFTPLHDVKVQFTTMILPDNRRFSLQTAETLGLNSIYSPLLANKKKQRAASQPAPNAGVMGTAKQQAKDRVHEKIDSITDMVRSPGKMERLEDFLVAKLPYHPQWIRRGTRFDAELLAPLQFGSAQVQASALRLVGSQPPPDSIVHVRLVTPLSSHDAEQGDKVEAIVSQPLFSADHGLILPEGTRLTGAVTTARAARWFHRGGQLRFSFREIEVPAGLSNTPQEAPRTLSTIATLKGVEPASKESVKVDDEGGVKAKEPKTRFIAPALAFLIATRAADNDEGRLHHLEANGTGNVGARSLGGASGFGLLGVAAAQASPTFAGVMGFYGLGWSVFSNIVDRGAEVDFGKNRAMDVRFGARPPAAPSKFKRAVDAVSGGSF